MGTEIEWSVAAERDLEDIWDTLEAHDPSAALRIVRTLGESIDLLALTPLMGRARPEIGAELRSLVREGYVLLYRFMAENQRVEVVRIIHERRNLTAFFD